MTWPGWEKFQPATVTSKKPFDHRRTSVPIEDAGYEPAATSPKPSKFHNVKTTVDGITFDSAKEARRWQELVLLEKSGRISRLTRQKRFALDVRTDYGDAETIHIATYVADFDYFDEVKGEAVTEDVKGVRTREYKIKRALMQALHGIAIRET